MGCSQRTIAQVRGWGQNWNGATSTFPPPCGGLVLNLPPHSLFHFILHVKMPSGSRWCLTPHSKVSVKLLDSGHVQEAQCSHRPLGITRDVKQALCANKTTRAAATCLVSWAHALRFAAFKWNFKERFCNKRTLASLNVKWYTGLHPEEQIVWTF